jgi:hypothetical protein
MKGYLNCVGCKINTVQLNDEDELLYESCSLEPMNRDDVECPCCTCIVKPMCTDSCITYRNFRNRDISNDKPGGD